MTTPQPNKDLLVVAADKQIQRTIETLLSHRSQALRIQQIKVDVLRHPQKDSGCRTASEILLDPSRNQYRKMVVIFDYDGSGENSLVPEDLESSLESRYESRGWDLDSVAFIVIHPELEAWMFGATYGQLQHAVGWSQPEGAKDWLLERGLLADGEIKPQDPKAAVTAMLRLVKKPLASEVFVELAQCVSLARCQDRAFRKFRTTLQRWFPA